MVTEITKGIKVSVETEYQPAYSSPSQYHYVFTYRITIENHSEYTIQLLEGIGIFLMQVLLNVKLKEKVLLVSNQCLNQARRINMFRDVI